MTDLHIESLSNFIRRRTQELASNPLVWRVLSVNDNLLTFLRLHWEVQWLRMQNDALQRANPDLKVHYLDGDPIQSPIPGVPTATSPFQPTTS
jgi:hypothetical protein